MTKLRLLIVVLVLSLLPVITAAEITGPPGSQDIRALFMGSDIVCQAHVAKVGIQTATVLVDRAYKGNIPAFRLLNVRVSSTLIPEWRSSKTILLFLLKNADGSYQPVGGAANVFQTSGTLLYPKQEDGLAQLEHDVAGGLTGADQDKNQLTILLGLSTIDGFTESRVAEISLKEPFTLRLRALAVLMTTNKTQYFEQTLQLLTNATSSVSSIDGQIIAGRVYNADAGVPTRVFDEFVLLPFPAVQLSALEVVRKRRSTESLPALMAVLTSSSSLVLKYIAIAALSEALPDVDNKAPSMREFNQNPNVYLEVWEKWWREKGSKLYTR